MSVMRMTPVLWLTVRQFRAGKATWVVAGFAIIPILLAVIHLAASEHATTREFLSRAYLEVLAPTVVPLATLVLATGALGNEVTDRTLPYLVLKPVPRWRIVLEKYVGAVLLTALLLGAGAGAAWALPAVGDGAADSRLLGALLVGTAGGIVAYGAVFLLVSLSVPRALLAGIVYVLVWESFLARFLPGIRVVSMRHVTQSLFVAVLDDPGVALEGALRLPAAAALLAAVAVCSLLLAVWWLRRMNLD